MAKTPTAGGFGRNRRTAAELEAHQQIMRVFTGLLLALFVSVLSATIVGNALPVIIADLGGDQLQYTWIVTASLLASTASTPIFGKLADLFDKKKLLLLAISIFTLGSVLAGFAHSTEALIGYRVLQGIGMGAQMALVQTTIASIISPRDRGKYNGYLGAVMAVATVSGPLIGGIIVDTPWLGWRWCYWSAVPFSLIAMWVLHRRLVVPASTRRKPTIDYWGSALIVASVTLLLLWLSFAGSSFDWVSWGSLVMVGGAVLGTVAFVLVEQRAAEPVVPLWILTERTTAMSIVASFAVGTVMFGAPVFLGQYFQIGRGYEPAAAGLMITPLMIGVFLASTIAGRLVSRRGTWKRYVVGGISIQAVGVLLMGTVGVATPLWLIGIFLALMGIGQGASMQNLVLAVQNTVRLENMGVASSTVAFFRTLGGAIGVQVLGAVLSAHIASLTASRLAGAGIDPSVLGGQDIDVEALPDDVEQIVRSAYGDGMAVVFLVMGAMAVIALLAALAMRNSMLRDTVDVDVQRAVAEGNSPDGASTPEPAEEGAPVPAPGLAETADSRASVPGRADADRAVPGHAEGSRVGAAPAEQDVVGADSSGTALSVEISSEPDPPQSASTDGESTSAEPVADRAPSGPASAAAGPRLRGDQQVGGTETVPRDQVETARTGDDDGAVTACSDDDPDGTRRVGSATPGPRLR